MSARTSMAALITALRRAIGDVVSDADLVADSTLVQTFTDEECQAFLDARRTDIYECELAFRPETAVDGTVSYHEFYAPRGRWEDDITLRDGTNATVTADTSDLGTGHWTFTANQLPPVYITGRTFDLAGAAYDALQAWAAKVATEFDFETDGQTFSRSQKRRALVAMAGEYARRMVPALRPRWRAARGEW